MKTRLFLSGLVLLGLAEELPDIAPSEWRLLKSDGVVAETFSHTFPPYSVTLLVLESVPWTAWLPWAGLGLILVVLVVLALFRHRMGRSR